MKSITADPAELRRALDMFFEAGQVSEPRGLDVSTPQYRRPHRVSGYFDDRNALAAAAGKVSPYAKGLYIVPTVVDPALLARTANRVRAITDRDPTTSDTNILRRRWLLLDADPVRPAAISSTEAEHAAGLARVQEISAALTAEGWPAGVVGDSGNGGHLLYRLDLPNDQASRTLLERVLRSLAFRFNDASVTLDQTVFNAARIWKLYGSVARKGDHTPERPHRVARLLSIPDVWIDVTPGQLEALVRQHPEASPRKGASRRSSRPRVEVFDMDRWIAAHGLELIGPQPWKGGGRWIFPICPWNGEHRNRSAYLVELPGGAIAAGCHHNSCSGKDWHALRDVYEPGWRESLRHKTLARPATGGAASEVSRTIEQPIATLPRQEGATAHASSGNDQRPWIDVTNEDLPAIAEEAWEALLAANNPPRLFLQGRLPARLERGKDHGHMTVMLTRERLRYELARAARWYVPRESEEGVELREIVLPPLWMVEDMLARPTPPFPPLTRVTETPVFAPDGTLQTTPGYHPASQTFYAPPPGLHVRDVPACPSREDILLAKIVLEEVLVDFPFVSEADQTHARALFLLPFVRDLIPGPTPNHLIEAPTPGSGKSLLADVLLRPAAGRHMGILTEARDEDEVRKRLTARLLEARTVLLLDNVRWALDSGQLAAALTAPRWEDRLLGRNETVQVPVRCVWVTTGNNPVLSTEMARRSIRIRLDPRQDRPWRRSHFQHQNLRAWVDKHRGDLIWAALVLAQHWLARGRPSPTIKPLGAFEEWSTVIGGILCAAEVTGFLGNLDEFYEIADHEAVVWRVLTDKWWQKFGTQAVGARDLPPLVVGVEGISLGRGTTERSQQTALGIQLRKRRDQVIGPYRVAPAGESQGAQQW